jgi:putative transport protein
VIGVLVCFQFLRKMWGVKPREGTRQPPITVGNFVVQNPAANGQTLAQFPEIYKARFVVSRIQKEGHTYVATGKTRSNWAASWPWSATRKRSRAPVTFFGAPAPLRIEQAPRSSNTRRVYLSSEDVVGKTIAELDLNKIPATVSRIRRGDTDFVATPAHAPGIRRPAARGQPARESGRMSRSSSAIPFAARPKQTSAPSASGMVLGVLLGMIPFPMPGGTFAAVGLRRRTAPSWRSSLASWAPPDGSVG